jgi:hypothetical protein
VAPEILTLLRSVARARKVDEDVVFREFGALMEKMPILTPQAAACIIALQHGVEKDFMACVEKLGGGR